MRAAIYFALLLVMFNALCVSTCLGETCLQPQQKASCHSHQAPAKSTSHDERACAQPKGPIAEPLELPGFETVITEAVIAFFIDPSAEPLFPTSGISISPPGAHTNSILRI